MKEFVNELYDYELTGEVKIEESEDEEEIPTTVIDQWCSWKNGRKKWRMFLNH